MAQTTDATPQSLGFWQIWNLTFGFFGTQFGWALQMSNTSAIYEYLGANPEQIPILWLAGPITGLIVQPLIGYFSDRAKTPFGRRKPFFLTGALLSSLALIFMPNSGNLWMAAGMLWILDTSFNSTVEPLRAFIGDRITGKQRTLGFAMQAFFIGLGAVVGALAPWIFSHLGILDNSLQSGSIPLSVKFSFYLGALVYMSCVLWTAMSTPNTPAEMEETPEESQETEGGGFIDNIRQMPKTMRQLAVVQFFTWVGMFCVFLYLPPAIARQIFGATNEHSALYTRGIEWAGIFTAVYNGVCFIASLFLARFARLTSRKFVHGFCLLCGGVGLIALFWIRDRYLIFLCATALGLAWASMLSMPYSILADALPPEKMGSYIGIFNVFIVVPQICVALGLGWVMSTFLHSSHLLAVVLGGFFLIIAALFVPRVTDIAEDRPDLREEEMMRSIEEQESIVTSS
ncbi:MAG: MFS transporter [Cyanobacteria bacterium SBLK]|nr:MFS transporter [Cyanobacteria bacterium SBLK]